MTQGLGGFHLLLGMAGGEAVLVIVGQVMVFGSNVSSVFPSRYKTKY